MGSALYTPLDQTKREIRLLRVAPYHGQDVLAVCECTMFTGSLSTQPPPKYNAFSYEWGSTEHISYDYSLEDVVIVNGHRVSVTKNLVALLTRYRNIAAAAPDWQAMQVPIWIDALCIDQSNVQERNSQVALMGAIYREAQATLSWLGEGDDDSDYAMGLIADIGSKILNIPKDEDDVAWVKPESQPELWQRSGYLNRFWSSAGALMKRTYWQRAWIVQEVLLQPNVIIFCGKLVCHYFQLEAIQRWLRRIQGRPTPPGVDVDLWQLLSTKVGWYSMGWNNLHKRIRVKPLEGTGDGAVDGDGQSHLAWKTWITNTLFKQATDPRDKLYSVLGLVGIDSLRPDYSSSAEKVFYDFATKNIRIERSLDILSHAGHWELPQSTGESHHPPAANLFVPSWVPNWDQISKTYDFSWFFNAPDRADKDWQSIHATDGDKVPWSVQGNTLITPGVLFEVIEETRVCDIDDGSWSSFCLDYINLYSGQLYPAGIPPLQALAHLVMRGRDFSGRPLESLPDTETLLQSILPGFCMTLYSGDSKSPAEDLRAAQETFGISTPGGVIENFLGAAQLQAYVRDDGKPRVTTTDTADEKEKEATATSAGQRTSFVPDSMNFRDEASRGMGQQVAFVTAKHYIGWARKGLQRGDHIVILPKCRMPVLLRKVDSRYIHLGPCHVPGLMDGEAITCVRQGTARLETFNIV